MGAKHTAGPWKVSVGSSNFGSDGCYGTVDDAEGTHIADIWEDGKWQNARYANKDEPAANARLIAAAPDLLAACEAVQRAMPGSFQVVRDAIAKATGDQP